jgi:3',5'-cyclic AMP phosphodiesterase CpdA
MTVLLHLSDTHFGTEQPPVVEALLRFAAEQRPDMAILSGDITQRARAAQFRAARQFVDRLAITPMLAVPGNHDIALFDLPRRLFSPYGRYRASFGADLEPVVETRELLVVGVRTTRRYRHVNGEVSREQIDRVARRLRAAQPAQLRIVVAHQPVHAIEASDEKNLLRGHRAAVRAWSDAGADLILGGHVHLPYTRSLRERIVDLPREAWCVQAGTATSWRVRRGAPNSVNLIRYQSAGGPRRCIVERWDYVAEPDRFDVVERTEITCDPA